MKSNYVTSLQSPQWSRGLAPASSVEPRRMRFGNRLAALRGAQLVVCAADVFPLSQCN